MRPLHFQVCNNIEVRLNRHKYLFPYLEGKPWRLIQIQAKREIDPTTEFIKAVMYRYMKDRRLAYHKKAYK